MIYLPAYVDVCQPGDDSELSNMPDLLRDSSTVKLLIAVNRSGSALGLPRSLQTTDED